MATEAKNVTIALQLMKQIIYLLEHWDISAYAEAIQIEYENVMAALRKKEDAMALRKAYSKIICAEGEESEDSARIEYLIKRNWLRQG